ncbi:glycosyltransferase family 2 protein [Algoriphagus sp. Y33]|uniref:glycosyltransferase family 2 protein n=1 Tax=Algoriphagus sp. Y33 TaxID=2772483 RepID=UPI001CE22041|nr:glycosyltransferase family 2 protein [Algoriphagus sp. Y33]
MILSRETVGVVVVTFQRNTQLAKTLNSIINQGLEASHIWIVNNDRKDNLSFVSQSEKFQGVNILHTKENIASAGGFALGMNSVSDAGLNWVWLFNDDSRPIVGSFDSLLGHSEILGDGKTGMVKLANLNAMGSAILQNWKGRRVPSYVPVSQNLIETDLITFDGCLIATQMIKEIGTCDPEYFMGTYEFDFCLKAKDNGFKIYTIPNGMIEDEKSGSVGGTPPWRQYYNTRNHLHLGIARKDLRIIWAWIIREAKFTYAILRFQDQKLRRLKLKLLALFHVIGGKRGKVFDPEHS